MTRLPGRAPGEVAGESWRLRKSVAASVRTIAEWTSIRLARCVRRTLAVAGGSSSHPSALVVLATETGRSVADSKPFDDRAASSSALISKTARALAACSSCGVGPERSGLGIVHLVSSRQTRPAGSTSRARKRPVNLAIGSRRFSKVAQQSASGPIFYMQIIRIAVARAASGG
jgi:hypothetical protein